MTSSMLTDVSDLPALATKKHVAQWYGCSGRHIDLMVKDGRFPKPIRAGIRSPRWRRSELLAWLDSQPANTSDSPE
jgi:predicted DNA-binding transcriptional regulator AlpA